MGKAALFFVLACFGFAFQTWASELTPNKDNVLFYRNFENVFDANGQYKEPDPTAFQIEPGDHFAGIINLQHINVGGVTTWFQSPTDQITGIFAARVEAIVEPDTYDPIGSQTLPHLVLGPPTVNMFCKGSDCFSTAVLEPGEIFALFRDLGATLFEYNGDMYDDVLKATDGELWLTLGYSAGGDNAYGTADDDGYLYSHVAFGAPLANFTGESWAGLNAIRNNTGYVFGGINDPSEYEIGDLLIPGLLNDVYLSNELEGNPGSVILGGSQPWDIASNDPAHMFPLVAVPCTLEVEKKCIVPLEPEDFVCSDAKPIDTLTMIWSGTETIKVVAHKGKKLNDPVVGTVDNIMVGDEVTISGFGGKTDVMWEIFHAGTDYKIGESIFHLSCSDQDMNGPEDCGKPQGDGKNKAGFINDWLFEGMAGDLTLDCDPTPPVGSDQCTIPEGGDVEYTYKVTNTGTEEVFNVSVEDDQFGTVPGSPILSIAPGGQETLTATQFVTDDTTNVVTVTGETVAGTTCSAMDSAEVIVVPLPFECDKPIKELTMIWDGTQEIRVKVWKGKVGSTLLADIDNIMPGDEVTVDGFTGKPNDVIWEIFEANSDTKIGESKFHLSCSDPDMNGPEDCGKREGDGKKNESKYINDWLLEGMVDKTSIFDCTP